MIPLFKVNMSPEAPARVAEVLASGMVGEGPRVEEFQKSLQVLLGSESVTCLNSCTSALVLALRLARVGDGRTVISTPFTFVATNTAIKEAGGEIKWAKIQQETLCADPEDIVHIVNRSNHDVAAVVVTLVGGWAPAGLDFLYGYLREHGIPLILDCAHALLTTYKGAPICNWADFCCFSFQSIKHLTTGDGGVLVCRDPLDHAIAQDLKWFGLPRNVPAGISRLEHQMTAPMTDWGYKFHMNDIAATIGISNLSVAKEAVEKSRYNTSFYNTLVDGICGLSIIGSADCESSCWVYGFSFGPGRDVMGLVQEFSKRGVTASPLWPMNGIYHPFPENLEHRPDAIFVPNGFWVGDEERRQVSRAIEEIFG